MRVDNAARRNLHPTRAAGLFRGILEPLPPSNALYGFRCISFLEGGTFSACRNTMWTRVSVTPSP